MAQVHMEGIVDHLSSEMRRALEAAVEEEIPDANVDAHSLFRAFRRAVGRKCNHWEAVPDQYIQK
jgi:hypothetical protein